MSLYYLAIYLSIYQKVVLSLRLSATVEISSLHCGSHVWLQPDPKVKPGYNQSRQRTAIRLKPLAASHASIFTTVLLYASICSFFCALTNHKGQKAYVRGPATLPSSGCCAARVPVTPI